KLDQHDVTYVRENMDEYAPRVACSECICGLYVLAAAVFDVLAAHQPENARPAGQPENEHHRGGAFLIEDGGDREDEQQIRYRREDAVDPVVDVVDAAAKIAGLRAEKRAYEGRQECGREPDEERRFSAFDDLLQNVATPLVPAERQRREVRACASCTRQLLFDG